MSKKTKQITSEELNQVVGGTFDVYLVGDLEGNQTRVGNDIPEISSGSLEPFICSNRSPMDNIPKVDKK